MILGSLQIEMVLNFIFFQLVEIFFLGVSEYCVSMSFLDNR